MGKGGQCGKGACGACVHGVCVFLGLKRVWGGGGVGREVESRMFLAVELEEEATPEQRAPFFWGNQDAEGARELGEPDLGPADPWEGAQSSLGRQGFCWNGHACAV